MFIILIILITLYICQILSNCTFELCAVNSVLYLSTAGTVKKENVDTDQKEILHTHLETSFYLVKKKLFLISPQRRNIRT